MKNQFVFQPESLLDVRRLSVSFGIKGKEVKICSQLSFSIGTHECVGLIGESGCGKTIVALSILRLLPDNALLSGEIVLNGTDLLTLVPASLQNVRGKDISMIFEQPKTCLNPVLPVGWQVEEAVRRNGYPQGECTGEAKKLLLSVGIFPEQFRQYPHQMSGGMQQRIMIAIAMASSPRLLIADEPTTALDLITQAQILDLIKQKIREVRCSLFIITHDLDVAAELCDRVMVMYAGEIVEITDIRSFLSGPHHPYSSALVHAIDPSGFSAIPGNVPDFSALPPGCRFHPRCPDAKPVCANIPPPLQLVPSGQVRCHFA